MISASITFKREVFYLKRYILLAIILLILLNNYIHAEELDISAQSAILIDAKSKRILYEHNPHIKLPMASTTKIMTALLALEKGKLDDKIEINKSAVGVEGSSIYLKEGEIISLEDLLYGLMLRSGNDSAVAIAEYIGEGMENFVEQMNQRAREIGANNTNFMNPHGLHHDNHYTTSYDLALITSKALEYDKFKEIVSTKVWKANRQANNIFYNKNKTLWDYEGGDGVKTGYTTKSGRCLVTSATREGTQLIAVVLNDGNWFEDCYKLMDYGFNNYKSYLIFDKGQFVKKIPVIDGEKDKVTAVISDFFQYPLSEEELDKVSISIDLPRTVSAPIKEGEKLGQIKVYLNGIMIHKEDIVSKENIDKIGFVRRFFNKINNK